MPSLFIYLTIDHDLYIYACAVPSCRSLLCDTPRCVCVSSPVLFLCRVVVRFALELSLRAGREATCSFIATAGLPRHGRDVEHDPLPRLVVYVVLFTP